MGNGLCCAQRGSSTSMLRSIMGGQEDPCEGRANPMLPEYPWLSTTLPEWFNLPLGPASIPSASQGAYWGRGNARCFNVRHGPNYQKHGKKASSDDALYDCLGVDIIKSTCPISEVLGRLTPLPQMELGKWTDGIPLPRVLCVAMLLPIYTEPIASVWNGPSPHSSDSGCTVVSFHVISDRLLKAIRGGDIPPAAKLFRRFIESTTAPSKQKPYRCPDGNRTSSGVLKAVVLCENLPDVAASPVSSSLLPFVHQHNGVPALVTTCGLMNTDGIGEWMEIDLSLRNWLTNTRKVREVLLPLQKCLPLASLQVGLIVQGVDDDELPETLLCCCRLHNLDLAKNAVAIYDPRGLGESMATRMDDNEDWGPGGLERQPSPVTWKAQSLAGYFHG
eukprot:NODE_10387_length_1356_cov_2.075671.p1 GENE.NODE_10387_length_1356_cov_2.075671~~NODE_10387_length_1356_cov_2.075671.p1  ORF type:complete len:390 (-),score=63.31 NODE_10387_length_1356_cov_2.075671:156-1325(-)